MPTYDKLTYNIPAYQEGNESDFEFELDLNFPIEQVSDITFQMRSVKGEVLLQKSLKNNDIALLGRVVNIPFLATDFIGDSGTHNYEIDFKNLDEKPFATIGGAIVINKEINRL